MGGIALGTLGTVCGGVGRAGFKHFMVGCMVMKGRQKAASDGERDAIP